MYLLLWKCFNVLSLNLSPVFESEVKMLLAQLCPILRKPMGSYPTRLLCPWDSPGKNTGVGCHFLLWGIFPMQKLNSGLLDCRQILYHQIYQRSPQIPEPNNDKTVKDQRDSPSLSSGGLLATRVKTSPWQVTDT